jgi:hypothetical protein
VLGAFLNQQDRMLKEREIWTAFQHTWLGGEHMCVVDWASVRRKLGICAVHFPLFAVRGAGKRG